jgi:hypothetical protein
MVYRTWDKMNNRQELLDQAEDYLAHLEEL